MKRGIEQIYQSDEMEGGDSLYCKSYSPQFHYTTKRGRNNNTKVLVYHEGEYHLFYRYNPYETNWGNIH